MFSLLKIEWMKIKSYKAFKVFSILYAVALLLTTFLCFKAFDAFTEDFKSNPIGQSLVDTFNPFKFPTLWSNAGFFLSMLVYFPCIIIITFCVNEFTFKTHRQNIIDGWTRQQFLTSKLLLILMFSIVITILFVISVWLFSVFAKIEFSFNGAEAIGYFFVQTFYYLLVAFICAILFRKSGIAIMIFLLYAIVVESVLLGVLNNYLLPAGYFLPLQAADVLTPLSIVDENKEGKKVIKSIYTKSPQIYYMLLTTFAYIGLWIFIGYKKFVKDDL